MLAHLDKVMDIMLPSLREERAATYSPFLPIDPKTGGCSRCRSCRMMPSAG